MVVVVTGSNSGFGLEIALAFARRGDRVFATMRDPNKSEALEARADAESLAITICPLDVTEPDTFDDFVRRVVDDAGSLDVLINNAGILRPGALEDLDAADIHAVMNTNVVGPLLLTRAALPQMRRQRSGQIIMISSLSGVAGLPGDVTYSASKFALEGATEALRHEIDRWSIRVALVEAGLYATGIFDASLDESAPLPAAYPRDSAYRALIQQRLNELRERLPAAYDPARLGELCVKIVESDGRQLRWPADDVAARVLATLYAHDDAGRDEFLRDVAGTQWWSAGRNAPDSID